MFVFTLPNLEVGHEAFSNRKLRCDHKKFGEPLVYENYQLPVFPYPNRGKDN